jgi:ACS family tartrate transporter-like MFS transporter
MCSIKNGESMDLESRVVSKVFWRILPLLLATYLASYLNRVNISFATGMVHDLHLTAGTYGLGAGLFFVGYFIFEIPSNLALEKFGARRWIARIMASWGLLSMAMALVSGVKSFMLVRFLLGVAEAGLFPGIVLYLTYWFPARWRGRMIAAFMVAIPGSLALGGPVSDWILEATAGMWGLKPWQWLFILEGLPTVLLALAILAFLPNRPSTARFLSAEEKDWLEGVLASERSAIQLKHGVVGLAALTDWRVLALSFVYFANLTTNLGIAFFLPQIIKGMGATDVHANSISAIPFVVGIAGVIFYGYLADRMRSRRKILLVSALVISALGLAGAGAMGPSYAAVALIALASFGIYGLKGPFWPLPSTFLTGTAAASGIALINSIGNLGGFAGPYILGSVKDATHSYVISLYVLAAFAVAAAFVSLFLRVASPAPERLSETALRS